MIIVMIIHKRIGLRPPQVRDGAGLHRLIAACPPLDLNSRYAYLLICRDFADTSVVATAGRRLLGAITAYRPQGRPDTLFVWQVAVAPAARGQGLARRMLDHLLARPVLRDIAWVEATVGPGNQASQRLFAGLAEARGTGRSRRTLFGRSVLGAGHEPEVLHRVGPLQPAGLLEAV